jgi:hypothetical protein
VLCPTELRPYFGLKLAGLFRRQSILEISRSSSRRHRLVTLRSCSPPRLPFAGVSLCSHGFSFCFGISRTAQRGAFPGRACRRSPNRGPEDKNLRSHHPIFMEPGNRVTAGLTIQPDYGNRHSGKQGVVDRFGFEPKFPACRAGTLPIELTTHWESGHAAAAAGNVGGMEPRVGLEPTTRRLRGDRSTIFELPRLKDVGPSVVVDSMTPLLCHGWLGGASLIPTTASGFPAHSLIGSSAERLESPGPLFGRETIKNLHYDIGQLLGGFVNLGHSVLSLGSSKPSRQERPARQRALQPSTGVGSPRKEGTNYDRPR